MSKQQLAGILEIAVQNPLPVNAVPDALRAWAEKAARQIPVPPNIEIERINCGPCDGDFISAVGCNPTRLIIFYHGGGFVFCSSRTHRVIGANLARAAGCAVLLPDYRLAPEYPAPAAHEDAFGIYRWALDRYASDALALSGDSAGGNLALATALRAKTSGLPLPAAIAMMSPWLDFAGEGASYRDMSDDPILSPELLDLFTCSYLGNGDRKSPKVTPFYADFRGLPPVLVHAGGWEKLRDDAGSVVERLKAAGVATELKIFEDMCHTWQIYAPMLDEGMASIEECAAFMAAHQARHSQAAIA
jgi:monoterpene epsilon-lactone hydrolase